MPNLVQRVKAQRPTFEVNTLALPFFLAVNTGLIEHVGLRLNERFIGVSIEHADDLEREMSLVAIDAILEKKPMVGLRELLMATIALDVDSKIEDVPDLTPPAPEKKQVTELRVVELEEEGADDADEVRPEAAVS